MDPERIKPAEWEQAASFQHAGVNLFGENYFLMQKALTDISSNMGVAINSMQRKDINEYMFGIKVSVEVKDFAQLNQFVHKLQANADIESVDIL
jgi:(p)ppGpp synthase/HD superfamily hydrolase